MTALAIIQFTDPHLFGGEDESLRGIATLPALKAALAHAQSGPAWPPDALLITGDIVQHDPAGYRHFRAVFEHSTVPVLCLPGNHDDPAAMRQALSGAPFIVGGTVDLKGWRIVLLDSHVKDAAHGHLSERELEHLSAALASAGGRHCLVCLHHHPVPMGSRWLDTVPLINADEFWARIDAHPQVRAVLWGHVHQAYDGQRGAVRLLATPSTGAQFLPGAEQFAIDQRPPGYRRLALGAQGGLTTEIIWLPSATPVTAA